jgi:HNH endonuclease
MQRSKITEPETHVAFRRQTFSDAGSTPAASTTPLSSTTIREAFTRHARVILYEAPFRVPDGTDHKEVSMAITDILKLTRVVKPVTWNEGVKILERDRFRCQYCGLDGMASFENALIMGVDFVHPRAHKGKKESANLVTACRPCNVLKGKRIFANFEEAKAHVLKRRADLYKDWEEKMARLRGNQRRAEGA